MSKARVVRELGEFLMEQKKFWLAPIRADPRAVWAARAARDPRGDKRAGALHRHALF